MNTSSLTTAVAALFAAFTVATKSHAQPLVTVEMVIVGDPGNADDPNTGLGAVAYEYSIGKYEVTLAQYATFLNAVAATDAYNLYNAGMATDLNIAGISRTGSSGSYNYSVIGSGNRPATFVNWFDAARFANWMHNGATNGASTETGAYTLNGATNGTILKNPEAKWWIPSEDEWYKAAHYDPTPGSPAGNYWHYPTRSDDPPGNAIGNGANEANYRASDVYSVTQSANYDTSQNYLTDVGSYSSSATHYGTYDQGGNAYEWNDAVEDSGRGIRGGAWGYLHMTLQSTAGLYDAPTLDKFGAALGFRVAGVPELSGPRDR
jgi:formylglycine-generating enzyme required for sulfatase activity